MHILNNGRFGMAGALSGTMKKLISRAVSIYIIHSFIHPSIYSFIYPFIHLFIHSSIHPFIIHPSVYPFILSIYSPIHSCNYLFIHCIHSFCLLQVEQVTSRVQFGNKLEVYGVVQEKLARMTIAQYVTEVTLYHIYI